jgi:hypothetical protein
MPSSGLTLVRRRFRLRLDKSDDPIAWLDLESFSQPLLVGAGIDTLEAFDREVRLEAPVIKDRGTHERVTWASKSTLWEKSYHLEVFEAHLEFYAEIRGSGSIDTIRFLEIIHDEGFHDHFALTKHFNDKKQTPARTFTRGTPAAFRTVFCPEPNSYAQQYFQPYEYGQVSVNADLDYCGGNFIANPGLLCFAVAAEPDREWLAMGLAVRPGGHLFSEFEYAGGGEFGLNLNCWGAWSFQGRMETPRLVLMPGRDVEDALRRYVDLLVEGGIVERPRRERPNWWSRPLVCGWGHQCYQADLFRIRSPRERAPDNAAYTLCTQSNYRDIVELLEERELPWGNLVIDARWFLAGGLKNVDVGRWPDLRGFVDSLHRRDKRVLLWWSPWDTDGVPGDQCVRYLPADPPRPNRPGRLAKFGQPPIGKKLAVDVTLASVRERIRDQIRTLLGSGPGCYDVDGFKIDHVAAAPGLYGMSFPNGSEKLFGVEATKEIHRLIYACAKEAKPDALVIGQSPNPYFADVLDMIRLGDVYTHRQDSVLDEMSFRACMSRIADPDWLIDTDGWPMPSRAAFLEYTCAQPGIGVPSLHYLTHLDTTGEPLREEDFALIKGAWTHQLSRTRIAW